MRSICAIRPSPLLSAHCPSVRLGAAALLTGSENETAGACGIAHRDTELVVALPADIFDSGEHCGREVAIRSEVSGAVVRAVVGDRVRRWLC